MMLGKRQRADSELSNPMLGGSSIFSTPTRCTQYNTQFSNDITPPHLSSRTRKRIRDNRPAEESIHENTINMLFEAQKQPRPKPAIQEDVSMATDTTPSHSRQSSLHSFWSLPTRPASRPSSSHQSLLPLHFETQLPTPPQEVISCFSCDAPLISQDGDSMDLDDVDIASGLSDFNCQNCHNPSCHNCSITNVGSQRHCLRCAPTQKRWVGGLGWVMDERGQMQRRWM